MVYSFKAHQTNLIYDTQEDKVDVLLGERTMTVSPTPLAKKKHTHTQKHTKKKKRRNLELVHHH